MIVTLDGQRLNQTYSPTTLEALIRAVGSNLAPGTLVVGVNLNGRPLIEDELDQHLSAVLAEQDQVDLESAARQTVAADALRLIAARLEHVAELQRGIAEQLNRGDNRTAMGGLGECVEVWRLCQQTLTQSSRIVGQDLLGTAPAGDCVQERVDELVTKLGELRDALDARDLVLLADLLHYDFAALCESWITLLRSLADELAAAAPLPAQP